MRIWKRPQENGIDEAEDGRVSADTDCKCDYNHCGEARTRAQLTQRVADVHGTMLAGSAAGIEFLQPAAGPLQPAATRDAAGRTSRQYYYPHSTWVAHLALAQIALSSDNSYV